MKKVFYLVCFLCLMTNIALGADAVLMADGNRLEEIRELYVAPDLGVNIGKADMVQGKAVVIHSGSPAAFWIREDIPLFKDDAVITLKGGRIRLQLNDGSILTLASETKLVLNQSVYDPESQTRSSFINMTFGKARFLVKKIKDITDSNFKIRTPTAVVGIRGSDFIITADISSTEVVTLDHTRLEVVSLTDPNMTKTVLNDYERIVVEHNALPSAIETISAQEAKQMMKAMEINPEKVQAGLDRIPKGIENKETSAPAPEKAKDEIKIGLREKSDVKQGVNAAPITIPAEKSGDVKTGAVLLPSEKEKPGQTETKTEVKTEFQDKIKLGIAPVLEPMKAEVQNPMPVFIASPTIESPKPEMKVDIQNPIRESAFISASTIEVPKAEIVEKPMVQDIIHSAVVNIANENKEVIQKVAEVRVQSANDTTIKDKAVVVTVPQTQTGSANPVQSGTVILPVLTDTKPAVSIQITAETKPVLSADANLPAATDTKLIISTPVSTDTKLHVSILPASTDTKPITATGIVLPVLTDTKPVVSTPISTDTKPITATGIVLPVLTDTKPVVSTPISTDTKPITATGIVLPVLTDTKPVVSTPISTDTKPITATGIVLPVLTDTKPAVTDVVKPADILPAVIDIKPALPRSRTSHVIK